MIYEFIKPTYMISISSKLILSTKYFLLKKRIAKMTKVEEKNVVLL